MALESQGKKFAATTTGKYKLQMFPGGMPGGEKEMIEQTQVGAIAISRIPRIPRISLGPVGLVVSQVNVFNLPFVFRSEAHMRAVVDGPIGQEIPDKITDRPSRLVALGWMDAGSCSLNTKKRVPTPAELKGMKVRMMGNPLFVDTMNAMGGNGIAIGYGEVFSALQTGEVDGAENNAPALYTSNHHTIGTKYYAQTNRLIIPDIFVMSRIAWDKLTLAEQALIVKFSREAQLSSAPCSTKAWRTTPQGSSLKAAGIGFVAVDSKRFWDRTAPGRTKYGSAFTGLIGRIEAANSLR